jgi:rRNA small subunit aminocarboxypropyltransferase
MNPLATVVIHHKENPRKCSLEPLRGHPGLRFVDHERGGEIDASGHLILEVGAPRITAADAGPPLMILDATWRHQSVLRRALRGRFQCRSLPDTLRTAYPRRSILKPDPDPPGGLASVEALHAALCILGHRDDTLLQHYRWRDAFLEHCRRAGVIPA